MAGRKPIETPDALLRQLQHSRASGARCRIDLDGTEAPADIAELRRALRRAAYREFPNDTVHRTFRADHILYWVEPGQRKDE